MYLDAILVDEPLVGGLEPRLGKAQPGDPHRDRLPVRHASRNLGSTAGFSVLETPLQPAGMQEVPF
jgi:hypothetical protein